MSKETARRDSSRSDHASPRYVSPYFFTKTGPAGEQRDTMLQSELQILPELGKSRRRGHKVPPPTFTYGVSLPRSKGVADALCYTPEKERIADPDFEYVRDYAALNRAAVDAGMLTARDQAQYRALNDIKRKVYIRDVSLAKTTRKFPDDMVFGTPRRPGTPIEEVLRHSYADKWLGNLIDTQNGYKRSQTEATRAIKINYHTKTSLLRQAKIPVEPKPLWKMSKFSHPEPRIDSFRSEDERQKAFSASFTDSIPRQGVQHSGIYNVPRTTVKI